MKSLQEVLHENHKKAYEEYKQSIIKQKKAKRKANIITTIVLIVLITIVLFSLFNMTTKAQEKCVKAGHTKCTDLLK